MNTQTELKSSSHAGYVTMGVYLRRLLICDKFRNRMYCPICEKVEFTHDKSTFTARNVKEMHVFVQLIASEHSGATWPPRNFTEIVCRTYTFIWVDVLNVCYILCLLCLCARQCIHVCALLSPAGKGLASWLLFVVYNCESVTFPLVSWVRWSTWLYRFLIFTPLLTLSRSELAI